MMAVGAESRQRCPCARALARLGLQTEIKEFDASTRTSADAAAAIGCGRADRQVVIFRARNANQPVLVIASASTGSTRRSWRPQSAIRSAARRSSSAPPPASRSAESRRSGHTGPVAFSSTRPRQYDEIWAAAGSPNAVFRLTPADLRRLTGERVIAVK
jgi:hypothetical protein